MIGDRKHGLSVYAHAMQIQALPLREVDKVELDWPSEVLILYFEVEPLMMTSGV